MDTLISYLLGREENLPYSGKLYETAIVHYKATGKQSLLNLALKNADMLSEKINEEKWDEITCTEDMQTGLSELYRLTGKQQYLDMARIFFDHPLKKEDRNVTEQQQNGTEFYSNYALSNYTGITDLAALTGNKIYINLINEIWENMVEENLHLTGATCFSPSLSNSTREECDPGADCCDICSAIANIRWNYRMYLLQGDSKYYDVLERILYNELILAENHETGDDLYKKLTGIATISDSSNLLPGKSCLTNLCQFIPSIPNYIYATSNQMIYVNLYVAGTSVINLPQNKVLLTQETGYPWNGNILLKVSPEKEEKFTLKLRTPGWTKEKPLPGNLYHYTNPEVQSVKITVNGKPVSVQAGEDGYISLNRKWNKDDEIVLTLPIRVKIVRANEQIRENQGKLALERGGIVYCAEQGDNPIRIADLLLSEENHISGEFIPGKEGGIYQLNINRIIDRRSTAEPAIIEQNYFVAIPYYARSADNPDSWKVWIQEGLEKNTTPE